MNKYHPLPAANLRNSWYFHNYKFLKNRINVL